MSFSSATFFLFGLLLTVLSPATAQTWSACNPTNASVVSCPDNPALGTNHAWDFSQTNMSATWNTTNGVIAHSNDGGVFTINKRFDSPTIQSDFYIFFGIVEVHMKAAAGQGVISSITLESDDLDEVDWELMGGNDTHVETNYFGKGNTTAYDRAFYYPVDKPQENFHNYTVHWTAEKIEWWVDTALVRTLPYAAANGGNNFPQTPMNVRIGIWAGGDPSLNNGTIEWAGGLTDFTQAPFTMYVQNVKVTDFGTGSAYQYSDKSGSWKSIKTVAGNSTTQQILAGTLNVTAATTTLANATTNATTIATTTATPSASAAPAGPSGWSTLSSGVKVGIYAGAGAVGAAFLGLITFCCIKQRRAGRREQAAYAARLETERREAEAYQIENKSPDALLTEAPTPSEYSHASSNTGYTKSGAAGFGSAGGYYAPTATPPMPSPATTYGQGGIKSPNTASFSSPSAGAYQGAGRYQSTGGFQSAGGFQSGGFQSAGGFHSPAADYFPNNNGGYPSQGRTGYFNQGYSNSNNDYGRPGNRF